MSERCRAAELAAARSELKRERECLCFAVLVKARVVKREERLERRRAIAKARLRIRGESLGEMQRRVRGCKCSDAGLRAELHQ